MRLYEEVIIHTRTGTSLAGSLRRKHGRWVVLSGARMLDGAGPPVKLDGDVCIPRENIDWAQRATAPPADPGRTS